MSLRRLNTRSMRPFALATLTACAALAAGCRLLSTPGGITVVGDGRRSWYGTNEAVNVSAAENTTGLWVLTPAMLKTIVFESAR